MEIAVCLYRIAQEALWNATKHARSERVELTISADEESIHLEIRDWGVGFHADESNGKAGIGLASMKERARLVNGTLDIKSAPGQGAVVIVDVPVPESTS
jgi:two-component system sensor histidine kinase UhpB